MKNGAWKIFVRGGALGDFILSLPLLQAFCASGRPVCLIGRRQHLDLLPATWRLDRFIDIDGRLAASLYSEEIASSLKKILPGAELYFFNRADRALEDSLMADGVAKIYWLEPRPTSPPHVAVRFFRRAGLTPPTTLSSFRLSANPAQGKDLWLHPGSGSSAKNCPVSMFADFAFNWVEKSRTRVWVSFGEADAALLEPVAEEFSKRKICYQPVLDPGLKELAALLTERAGFYLGNDSGVSHLAGVLGISCLVLFRSTEPAIWRPFGDCRCHRITEDSASGRWPFEVEVFPKIWDSFSLSKM